MARKKKNDGESGESWLNTYADMVTLLLTFFVMLFSMSSVEETKFDDLLKALESQFGNEALQELNEAAAAAAKPQQTNSESAKGGSAANSDDLPDDMEELYQYLKAFVQQANMENSVDVQKGQGSVFIRFKDSIFFNPDSAVLKQSSYKILDFLGDCLKNIEGQLLTVNINGHTASVTEENYPVSDRRLSGERASNVAIYFEEEKHIDPKKMIAIGYGKNFPIDSNDTYEGRQNNRRVEIIIVGNQSNLSDKDIISKFLTGTYDESKYPVIGGSKDILVPNNGNNSSAPQSSSSSTADAPTSSSADAPSNSQSLNTDTKPNS